MRYRLVGSSVSSSSKTTVVLGTALICARLFPLTITQRLWSWRSTFRGSLPRNNVENGTWRMRKAGTYRISCQPRSRWCVWASQDGLVPPVRSRTVTTQVPVRYRWPHPMSEALVAIASPTLNFGQVANHSSDASVCFSLFFNVVGGLYAGHKFVVSEKNMGVVHQFYRL